MDRLTEKILTNAYLLTQSMNDKEVLKMSIVLIQGLLSGWK